MGLFQKQRPGMPCERGLNANMCLTFLLSRECPGLCTVNPQEGLGLGLTVGSGAVTVLEGCGAGSLSCACGGA